MEIRASAPEHVAGLQMPMWLSGFSEAGSTFLPSHISWSIRLEESCSFSSYNEFVEHYTVAKDKYLNSDKSIDEDSSNLERQSCLTAVYDPWSLWKKLNSCRLPIFLLFGQNSPGYSCCLICLGNNGFKLSATGDDTFNPQAAWIVFRSAVVNNGT